MTSVRISTGSPASRWHTSGDVLTNAKCTFIPMKTTLIELYTLQSSGRMTEQEVADALNIPLRSYRIRCTKWGHRFPLMLTVLDKIAADSITRSEAAETLGVSVRQVNKLSESWKVQRPVKEYLIERTRSKVKWEIRKKHAIDFISGSMPLDEAAERSGVSTRMMRRWVSDLLMKHFEMPWKDLVKLPDSRRRRLAQTIEDAEGLELAKQNVLNAIARGDKTLHEEALERVAARRLRLRK